MMHHNGQQLQAAAGQADTGRPHPREPPRPEMPFNASGGAGERQVQAGAPGACQTR